MKYIFPFLFCLIIAMPVFSSVKDNIEMVNKEEVTESSNMQNNIEQTAGKEELPNILQGSASYSTEPPKKEININTRTTLTNLEYDAKYLKDGKAKNFERSNIEYSGVKDFFNY